MNLNLIQLDENRGISIDEESNYKVVEKENEKYSLSYILNMENALEDLKNKLNDSKEKFDTNNKNDEYAKKLNIFLVADLVFGACMNFVTLNGLPFQTQLLTLAVADGLTYSLCKLICISKFQTKAKRAEKAKNLESIIDELENEVVELEEELKMAKEKIMYNEKSIDDFYINTFKQNSNCMNNCVNKQYSVKDSLYVDDYLYELPVYNLYMDNEELSKDECATFKKTK